MRYRSALVILPLAVALTACGSAEGGSAGSSTPAPASSTATQADSEALSGKATCDRLVNGDNALGIRVADYAVELMNGEGIDDAAYTAALDLTGDVDELSAVADPAYSQVIENVQAGPEAVVNAVEGGGGSFTIPAQEMMQASLDAGTECLSGPALDEYAAKVGDRVDRLPAEYGGAAQRECIETMYVGIVSSGWDLVVASIGAADHQTMTDSFYETVSDLSDDSEAGCAGDVELAQLTFETSVLRVSIMATGEGDYEPVRQALAAWLTAIDREDVELAAP